MRNKESTIFWLLGAIFVVVCICLILYSNAVRTADPLRVAEITSASVPEQYTDKQNDSAAAQVEPPLSPININTATADEFLSLPGIGEVLAARIIDYREQNGVVDSIAEIKEVSGIGDATFEAIKDMITV